MTGRYRIEEAETIATVICEKEYLDVALKEIRKQRWELIDYMQRDELFRLSFESHEPRESAPEIAKLMASAASRMGVGPMAAVAGAIAHLAVVAMQEKGASHAVVDNGGDIALLLAEPITVGIFAGESTIKDIGFRFEPRKGIFGICTSSGTVGPSISLGKADAATVIAGDAVIADAAATALGNAVKKDSKASIDQAFVEVGHRDLEGMVVITGNHIGVWGKVPQFIKVDNDYDLITKGK